MVVVVGLRTEAEHVPGVQTVLVARPTLDGFLCKRTIGHGARLVAPPLGEPRFLVSDSVDDLDPSGFLPRAGPLPSTSDRTSMWLEKIDEPCVPPSGEAAPHESLRLWKTCSPTAARFQAR